MRPVRLRMHGFAAFREPTEVDFTDVEYFALVGPTGSGKSTVIDAMTFALYGSVPRWGNRGVVGLALSPTASRGTVSLEFDVGGQRYVAARDLRRSASGSVTVREARLERVLTHDTEGDQPETESLATGGAVSKAVEDLLGLPFDQFCMCVVLPQGEFAQFLRAVPAERQKVLTRILGLGMYEQMAKEAGTEAKRHGQTAEVLARQLGGYSDVTEQVSAAQQRVEQLAALLDRIRAALPDLAEYDSAVRASQQKIEILSAERDALAGLTVPQDLAELGPAAQRIEQALRVARSRVADAEAADTAARERRAQAPDPEPLRRMRAEHAELAKLHSELPTLINALATAETATVAARTGAAAAEVELERAGRAREETAAARDLGEAEGKRLAAERALLDAPRVPDGLARHDRDHARASAVLAKARDALAEAEAAAGQASNAAADGPDRALLIQARREHTELAEAEQRHREAQQRAKLATARRSEADTELHRAKRAAAEAVDSMAAAQRTDLVGALRPTLTVHQPCPVCEHHVDRLPAPVATADLAVADHAVREAQAALDRASDEQRAAANADDGVAGELAGLSGRITALRAGLNEGHGGVGIEQVDQRLAEAERLAGAARDTAQRVARARVARDTAEREHTNQIDSQAKAERVLRAARDPLVALGAPMVEVEPGQPLEHSWRALTEWAGAQVASRAEQLTRLRAEFVELRRGLTEAERGYGDARERLGQLRAAAETALRTEQDASSVLGASRRRVDELTAVLDGAPDDDTLARELAELAQLEMAVKSADIELRAARTSLTETDSAAQRQAQRVEHGWGQLRGARDPLVSLGAPEQRGSASSGADLVAAWRAITEWATEAAAVRIDQLAETSHALEQANELRNRAHRELTEDLHALDVEPPLDRPLAHAAEPAASAALEQARAEVRRIAERRDRVAKLSTERDNAVAAQQVAGMLADLLNSKNFPRWLVASALDALVVDASRVLEELSGGQFELTHSHGEFEVIDHADADARRPVKTLSGGETFQASLALALALSEQLSMMASAGAARLDSIFLDEGFGTLDESNLDVVASTLENLAIHRDRMVGVITHVPALAERVPVRFAVHRDQRTASISRQELA